MSHQLSLLFFFLSSFLLQVTHLVLSFFLFFFLSSFFTPTPFFSFLFFLCFFTAASSFFLHLFTPIFFFFSSLQFFFHSFFLMGCYRLFRAFLALTFRLDYFILFFGFVVFMLLTGFMTWDQSFKYQHQTLKTEIFWLHFLGLFYEIRVFFFFFSTLHSSFIFKL